MAWLPVVGVFYTREIVTPHGTLYSVTRQDDGLPCKATHATYDARQAERVADSLRKQGYVQVSGR